jgi:anaerobic magnesium-protoporphyrin IX monomethyl ester cyclase
MDWVTGVCANVKQAGVDTKVLLSGTHPSALPHRTLAEVDCDFGGRGDGDSTTEAILEGAEPGKVPNLWYIENGEVLSGPHEKLLSNAQIGDLLSRAAWDLLDVPQYRSHDWHALNSGGERQPYGAIYTSIGCIFDCTFCCINSPYNDGGATKNTMRFRRPEDVVDEIDFLVSKHGVRQLKIIDEMFVLNQGHYMGIVDGLIERGLGKDLNIWAYARVDTINEGNLERMRQAGIEWLILGIESGSQHVRDGVEKSKGGRKGRSGFGWDDIAANVRKVQAAGINVLGNYIFGLPDDDQHSMEETMRISTEVLTERPNFYCAMPYPGSKLHTFAQNTSRLLREGTPVSEIASLSEQERAKRGLLPIPKNWDPKRPLLPEDEGGPGWIGYSQHSYDTWPLPTEHLHPKEVLAFRDKALPKYFGNPEYRELVRTRFGQEAVDTFCKVNATVPERRILTNP